MNSVRRYTDSSSAPLARGARIETFEWETDHLVHRRSAPLARGARIETLSPRPRRDSLACSAPLARGARIETYWHALARRSAKVAPLLREGRGLKL